MMAQTNLIDALERQTETAVTFAAAFADPTWYRAAEYTVERLIRRGDDFTTDDVWQLMRETGLSTPEPRALGAIIRQATKSRRIISTGTYRKSMRPECHRRPLAVWRPVNYRQVRREAE